MSASTCRSMLQLCRQTQAVQQRRLRSCWEPQAAPLQASWQLGCSQLGTLHCLAWFDAWQAEHVLGLSGSSASLLDVQACFDCLLCGRCSTCMQLARWVCRHGIMRILCSHTEAFHF